MTGSTGSFKDPFYSLGFNLLSARISANLPINKGNGAHYGSKGYYASFGNKAFYGCGNHSSVSQYVSKSSSNLARQKIIHEKAIALEKQCAE